jgi:hypothetical protein
MSDRSANKPMRASLCKAAFCLGVSSIATLLACGGSSSSSSAGPPSQIQQSGGSGQSATVGTAFGAPFAVTVEDSKNNPVSGAAVTFTAPASGPSGTFANGKTTETDNTNSSGIATSSAFTANSAAGGPYNVTAAVSGVSTTVSYSLVNTPASIITVTEGFGQGALINTAFATPLQVSVTPAAGDVSVTFTAPSSGASGSFGGSTTPTKATVTTNGSGVATAPTFTANGTTGIYTITVSTPASPTSVNITLINTSATSSPLAAGNYVFALSGTDSTAGFYTTAGVFTLNSDGLITGGEQTFADGADGDIEPKEPIAYGAVATTDDGNVLITLNTDVGPASSTSQTLHAAVISSSKALLTEFDSFATASGELDLQTSTAALCPSAPTTPCGYAFFVSGIDSKALPLAIGGVIAINGASGGITGSGSVFDVSESLFDGGASYPDQAFAASTVGAPDALGRVEFNLNSNGNFGSSLAFDGYIVDTNHIRLIENRQDDNFHGVALGEALAQTGTGGFNASSIEGASYVVSLNGADHSGNLEVAGLFAASASGNSVSGAFNYNDATNTGTQLPLTIDSTASTYSVDATGRVTVIATDDKVSFNVELYLTGDGNAVAITLDGTDTVAGFGYQQTGGGSFTQGSFSGRYGLVATGAAAPTSGTPENEFDAIGSFSANGSGSFSGTGSLDLDWILNTGPVAGANLSGTYSANPDGVFTGTITGLDAASVSTQDSFSYYLVDTTKGVLIETDKNQLNLGLFELE